MQYTINILDLLVTISYNIQQRLHIAPRGWNLDCWSRFENQKRHLRPQTCKCKKGSDRLKKGGLYLRVKYSMTGQETNHIY